MYAVFYGSGTYYHTRRLQFSLNRAVCQKGVGYLEAVRASQLQTVALVIREIWRWSFERILKAKNQMGVNKK